MPLEVSVPSTKKLISWTMPKKGKMKWKNVKLKHLLRQNASTNYGKRLIPSPGPSNDFNTTIKHRFIFIVDYVLFIPDFNTIGY